jgi:hypothetical protein
VADKPEGMSLVLAELKKPAFLRAAFNRFFGLNLAALEDVGERSPRSECLRLWHDDESLSLTKFGAIRSREG